MVQFNYAEDEIYEFIKKTLLFCEKENHNILDVIDIGAGSCPYKHLFKNHNYTSHDSKIYDNSVKRNGDGYGDIDIISDIENIPLADRKFDLCLCTEVFEHIKRPIKAFEEILRITKDGGLILITSPFTSGSHNEPYHFYAGFSLEFYKFLCDEYNCEIIFSETNGGFLKLMSREIIRLMNYFDYHFNNDEKEAILYLSEKFWEMEENGNFNKQFNSGWKILLRKN